MRDFRDFVIYDDFDALDQKKDPVAEQPSSPDWQNSRAVYPTEHKYSKYEEESSDAGDEVGEDEDAADLDGYDEDLWSEEAEEDLLSEEEGDWSIDEEDDAATDACLFGADDGGEEEDDLFGDEDDEGLFDEYAEDEDESYADQLSARFVNELVENFFSEQPKEDGALAKELTEKYIAELRNRLSAEPSEYGAYDQNAIDEWINAFLDHVYQNYVNEVYARILENAFQPAPEENSEG